MKKMYWTMIIGLILLALIGLWITGLLPLAAWSDPQGSIGEFPVDSTFDLSESYDVPECTSGYNYVYGKIVNFRPDGETDNYWEFMTYCPDGGTRTLSKSNLKTGSQTGQGTIVWDFYECKTTAIGPYQEDCASYGAYYPTWTYKVVEPCDYSPSCSPTSKWDCYDSDTKARYTRETACDGGCTDWELDYKVDCEAGEVCSGGECVSKGAITIVDILKLTLFKGG